MRRRHPESEETQGGFSQNQIAQADRRDDDDDRRHIWQHVQQHDAQITAAKRPRRFDIGVFLCRSGLAGETVNAMILYLIMTSRLLQNILSAAIKGESGVGKTRSLKRLLLSFPRMLTFFSRG